MPLHFYFLGLKKLQWPLDWGRSSSCSPPTSPHLPSSVSSDQEGKAGRLRQQAEGNETRGRGAGKNESRSTGEGGACGKTKNSQLKNVPVDRDEKQDTEGLTCIGNKKKIFHLHTHS